MDVGSIMSPLPVTLSPASRLDEATEVMDSYGVRHLPVVEGGRVIGMVGDRDLFAGTGWRPARDGLPPERPSNEHRAIHLADVMHPATLRLSPEDDLLAAVHGIAEQRVGCLPVERDHVLIGIVTEIDVLQAFSDLVRTGKITADGDPPVADLMTREVETAGADMTLEEALDLCESLEVHHLPVLSGGNLIGMVSDRDLARAVGRGSAAETELSELMSHSPITLASSERASIAAARLVEDKIGALPVLKDEVLVGLLSTTDILNHTRAILGV